MITEKELELTKADFIRNRQANVDLIKNNLIQIEMAKKVIDYFDEELKNFPEEKELFGETENPKDI
jgi:hypothetical protein